MLSPSSSRKTHDEDRFFPSAPKNLAFFPQLIPAIFGAYSATCRTPLPQRAIAVASARHSGQKRIKIAAFAVSQRGGERAWNLFLSLFVYFFRHRQHDGKSKSENGSFPFVQSLHSALSIANQMPPIGPAPPLGGAGGGRGRREREGPGDRKRESSFWEGEFSAAGEQPARAWEKPKLFSPVILPATLGPFRGSKPRASAPRRAIRRGACDGGDRTRKGGKDAERDSAGGRTGFLRQFRQKKQSVGSAPFLSSISSFRCSLAPPHPRATPRPSLKRTGRWPWRPGCRRGRGPW